jgi:hypothetical protein
MRRFPPVVALLVLAVLPRPSAAADADANLVVRLGRDTTSVERIVRTKDHVTVNQVGRAPRVLEREYAYDFDGSGSITHVAITVTAPGAELPLQTVGATRDGDSVRVEIRSGSAAAQRSAVALPATGLFVPYSSPWVSYEAALMRLAKSRANDATGTIWFIGGSDPGTWTLHRLDRDSVEFRTSYGDVFHFRTDRDGRLLGALPVAGTGKFTVDRVASLDLAGLRASYVAREKAGAGVGTLSPRDTARADVAGASLLVDYGRPSKRGRQVFGGIVPYGEVWRTGANAATQFRTDHDLDFGGTVVPAGFYTLWTLPTANGWTLIVNTQTGQWGTEHHADRDLVKIPMRVESLGDEVEHFTISIAPGADGGELRLDWDHTRAAAAFRVKS